VTLNNLQWNWKN